MNKVAVGAVTGLGGDAVSPEETVRAELSAWGRLDVDEIMSHASADAVWDNVAIRAFRGYDEIREAVQGISTARPTRRWRSLIWQAPAMLFSPSASTSDQNH
jgi:hypothetical protein